LGAFCFYKHGRLSPPTSTRALDAPDRRSSLELWPGASSTAAPVPTTPFLRRSGSPSTLTTRELEIVRCAATGLSSAEIAQALYLSTRTVDTHLGHVSVKLDVRGRTEMKIHPRMALLGGKETTRATHQLHREETS
jgi:DNA-binding CsgD family transcriptional regulator